MGKTIFLDLSKPAILQRELKVVIIKRKGDVLKLNGHFKKNLSRTLTRNSYSILDSVTN